MVMKNKKAWIRIVEAFLASLIILGAVLVIMSRTENKNLNDDVYDKQREILDVIAKNESLRNQIILNQYSQVKEAISNMIPLNWNFSVNICNINEVCNKVDTPNDRELYASEVIITSTLKEYNPKKLRFFVWKK